MAEETVTARWVKHRSGSIDVETSADGAVVRLDHDRRQPLVVDSVVMAERARVLASEAAVDRDRVIQPARQAVMP